jgi:hypothetical protein
MAQPLHKYGLRVSATLVLWLQVAGAGQAAHTGKLTTRSSPVRQPRVLQVTSTKVLNTPAFGFYGVPLCDGSGNLYLSSLSAVFKLSQLSDSENRTIRVPPDRAGLDDGSNSMIAYAVTPSGGFYVLGEYVKQQFHVFSFDSDGGLKHDSKLEAPEGVLIVEFAVFEDETILAAGYYWQDAPKNVRGKSYAAIFDRSGQLLRDMTGVLSIDKTSPSLDIPIVAVPIQPGDDGNLYLLKESSVLVISPGGGIVRQIRFVSPDPDTHALGIRVADGLVVIELGYSLVGKPFTPKYLVMDATTGREYGYYAPPEKSGRLARFSRDEGFVFLKTEKGKFALVSARMN